MGTGVSSKTVYILGAGFSRDAHAPIQREIIKDIFAIDPEELPTEYQNLFKQNLDVFTKFLENTMHIPKGHFPTVALEDVFTPIDRCLVDNLSFRGIAYKDLFELREKISSLIVMLFRYKLEDYGGDSDYVQQFAEYLVDIRRRYPKKDSFAVISTNWDILLDNALKKAMKPGEGVIDYCCYVTPFRPEEGLMPGIMAIGKGKFNVKLLKIHGSMNWLHCQRCQRLFATFFEKIALKEYLSTPICRLCRKNHHQSGGQDSSGQLVSTLLMPTFLKDLNNVQLKLIWHNAGIELSEASKVVFIGYSFPIADFELRQLLARNVRHTARISVVLHQNDDPCAKSAPPHQYLPEFRYKSFFGKRELTFHYDGVSNFVRTLPR